MSSPPVEPIGSRLRARLTVALKERDRAVVDALRSAIAAIENAEAVSHSPGTSAPEDGPIAGASRGAGSSDVARRELTEDEVDSILRGEIDGLRAAVEEYETVGQVDAANDLRRGANALAVVLDG